MANQNNNAISNALPAELEQLLISYSEHCTRNGLRESSIKLYIKRDRWFLENLVSIGCECPEFINASNVSAACCALKSNCYLTPVRTFLRFLVNAGYTDRDYSHVIPLYKHPQPMPSVYSIKEIQQLENTARNNSKRNYAVVLLVTRLGIRSSDIALLSFDEVDFDADVIRLVQKKTGSPIELPLLPEIKEAIQCYIKDERPNSNNPCIFLNKTVPYNHITNIGIIIRRNLRRAGIEAGARRAGSNAFRLSLASSMVNDNIPYDVVRKTLGHIDTNAIKSYARLDIEQLRAYALAVPKATDGFADFLAGKVVL